MTVRAAPSGSADASSPAGANDPGALQLIPLAPDTVFVPARVGDWKGTGNMAGAPEGQRAIYSNTLGQFAVPIPANTRFADDVTLSTFPVSPGTCLLRGLEFPVVGRVNPTGTGGAFTINYALYTNCPNSVPVSEISTITLPGSIGQVIVPDETNRLVQVQFGDGLSLPDGVSSLWFGVTFSRSNVGLVVGAPALEGFSCDLYDFPGAASQCNASFGGFPDHPFGAINLEIFGSTDSCGEAHVGYRANRPAQGIINLGANVTIRDDITLGVQSCRMVGYEVAVKGAASYVFDLRNHCDTASIPGTQRFFQPPLGSGPSTSVIARQIFSPPIQIPQNLYFAAITNSSTGGVVLSGQQACVGSTLPTLDVDFKTGGCNDFEPPAGQHGALNVTIFCEGPAPTGACCDMYFTDSAGEATCREVPQMNCAFPPRYSTNLGPFWEEGETCDTAPFNPPCGYSACCKPDQTCQNMTHNECNAVEPLTQPRQWQRGLPCGSSGQTCPRIPCLAREGECTRARNCPISVCGITCYVGGEFCPNDGLCEECPPVGCNDAECCETVCLRDDYCCLVEWDDACADQAVHFCGLPQSGDECAPSSRLEGATMLSIPDSEQTSAFLATESTLDPGFGCYKDNPGATAFDTHWYKFIAPPPIAPATRSIVYLSTCASSSPANDSLVQVFAVADPTDEATQCDSLMPIACNDDFPSPICTRVTTLSGLCARDLIPGSIYYVLVGGKTRATSVSAAFRLDISQVSSGCVGFPPQASDYCPGASSLLDGVTPFSFAPFGARYSLDQVEPCLPSMTADMWFRYTATCTGSATVHTCGPTTEESPDTNLAVYSSCPTISTSSPLGCNQDAGGSCGLSAIVSLDVVQGEQYVIRLGDDAGNQPSGNLTVACTPVECPRGALTWVDEGPSGVPPNAFDARRPHHPNDPSAIETPRTLLVSTTRDAQSSCFNVCETAALGAPIEIESVTPRAIDGVLQQYEILLTRPVTPGAKTTIRYSQEFGEDASVALYSHPGNANADTTSDEADIAFLLDRLSATGPTENLLWKSDMDRSGVVTAADLLELVDLLNGAGAYEPWINTPNPQTAPGCP